MTAGDPHAGAAALSTTRDRPEDATLATSATSVAPRWLLRPPAPPRAVDALMRSLSVPPLLAAMLWSRGLRDARPDHLNPLLEPTRIPDLDSAAERLDDAIRGRRRILVHGDYDADGITGTAILTLGLRELGATVTPFIPNRLTDGYGVHPDRVLEHIEHADLFLTVDCGVSNVSEIAALQAAGVEVIVSDHHSPGDALPDCLIVHPGMSPLAQQGLPELTGAGVAFHLLWALRRRLGLEAPLDYADLAALGTIADVAPLLGENRALVVEGLRRMASSRWPGIRASVAQAHLRGEITARSVAFVLAPRLNAAGRLGEAGAGLELLITASERRARELAAYLDARNLDRRKLQDAMLTEALELVDPRAPAIVVNSPDWHPGVMGIVASKLVERFYRPVYIVAKGKGSVRSTPGISAVNGLRAASQHLLRFGGHAQAAGFALDMANLPAFRNAICDYAAGFPTPQPTILADAIIAGDEIDDGLWQAIRGLEPFGEGHPAPVFALTGVLDSARAVGKQGATLQLRVGGVKGVAWRMGELAMALPVGAAVNTAASLTENEWQDRKTLEFIASAVRPAEPLGFEPSAAPALSMSPSTTTAPRPCIHRGAPTGPASEIRDQEQLDHALRSDAPLWITEVPPEHALSLLRSAVAAAVAVADAPAVDATARETRELTFDLEPRTLQALDAAGRQRPTVHDLRRGFVATQRALPLPFGEAMSERVRRALEELELVDSLGHALRGQKRDPYQSDTLRAGLLERYLLLGFVRAYQHLDDAAFAITLETFFGDKVG